MKTYKEEINHLEMIKNSILSKNKPSLMKQHFLVCNNCDSTINNKYIRNYDCPVCKVKNVFMTETVKNNLLSLDEEIEKIKQERLQQRKPIKITKSNSYRINFVYNNKHYSLACSYGDGYEEYIYLMCKEDRNFHVLVAQHDDLCKYLPPRKHGQTYKNTDLTKLHEVIEDFIENC